MADIKFSDVRAEDQDYRISLGKVTGQKVKDIQGSVTIEFGEPYFQIYAVILEDGTEIGVEGEHDIAYLTAYGDGHELHVRLDEDTLMGIYNSDPDHANEYEGDDGYDGEEV